jgi:photosystem II stability/assembly factor-like uncharacterized protein
VTGKSAYLLSVYFIDDNAGWTVKDRETVLKTKNGEMDWIIQTSDSLCTFNTMTT